MDELGIKLRIGIDEGIELAKKKLDAFIKEYSNKEIKIDIGGDVLNSINAQMQKLSATINNINTNGLAKVSKTFKENDLTMPIKTVQVYNKSLGVTETIITALNKKTKEFEKTTTKTTNYEVQQKALQDAVRKQEALDNKEESRQVALEKKRITVVNARNKAEIDAAQRAAKAKESAVNSEEKREDRLTTKRINALNQIAKKKEVSANAEEKREIDLELKRISAVNKREATQSKTFESLTNKADKLTNSLAEMDSSVENKRIFSKNPEILNTFKQLNVDVDSFKQKLADGTATVDDYNKLNKNFSNLKSNIKVASNEMGTFTNTLAANLSAFLRWYVLGNIIGQLRRSISAGLKTIQELDDVMIELRKVTDEAESAYTEFYYTANKTAKFLGISTKAVIEATANWSRLGYSIKDASKLAEYSAIFSNISNGLDIGSATNTIVSTIKSFGLSTDDVLDGVISKVNEVGNKFAISNEQIASALSESSASMAIANNTLDETIALLTSAVEITQDASAAGNALKTVSMRIRGYDEATEELSEDLKDVEKTIKSLTGVSLFTDDTLTTYKSTYEILQQISKVFSTLTDKSRAEVLELLAGKRQGNVVGSILSNFKSAEGAITVMADSAGGALREQATYMESVSAKINEFKESIIGFWQNLISTDFIKFWVDVGTKLITILDKLINGFGGLGAVMLTASASFIVITALMKTNIGLAITQLALAAKTVISRIAISAAYVAETAKVYGLNAALLALKTTTLGLMASNPLMWVALAGAALFGLIKLFDKLNTSVKEQKQLLADQRDRFDQVTSSAKDLQAQLDEIADKIDELNSKGSLTLIEQQELESLKETNDELERQLKIRQAEAEIEAKKLAREAVKTFEKVNTRSDTSLPIDNTDIYQARLIGLESIGKAKQKLIEQGKDVNPDGTSSKAWNDLEEAYLDTVSAIQDLNKEFDPILSDLQELVDTDHKLTSEQQSVYNTLIKLKDGYNEIIAPQSAAIKNQKKFEDLWSSDSFSKAKRELEELSKTGKLNGSTIKHLSGVYYELGQYLQSTGVTTEELAEHIKTLSGETENATDTIFSYVDAQKLVAEGLESLSNKYDMVDSAIYKVKNNQSLSHSEILKLIQTYPNLTKSIIANADGYFIEETALRSAITADIDAEKTKAQMELAKTANTIQAVKDRVRAYSTELLALKTSEEAYDTFVANLPYMQAKAEADVKATSGSVQGYIDLLDKLMANLGSGGGSGGGSTKVYEYDKFLKLKQEVLDIESELAKVEREINGLDEDSIDGLKQKNILLAKQISLYGQQQSALHKLNNARDTQLEQDAQLLRNMGVQVSYDADLNKLAIDYEKISKMSGKAQEAADKLAKEMESLNSDNQDASETWKDLADSIKSAQNEIVASLDKMLDKYNESLDSIQNVYKTLQEAAEEYSNSGNVSVDTLQSILSLGVQYLSYLQDENGNLVINKENIEKVIKARTEELAVNTALNYVEQIKLALHDKDTAKLNNLLDATVATTGATWELVYANLALLDLDSSQYAKALQNINNLRSLAESAVASVGQTENVMADLYQKQATALEDLLNFVKELIKWETQNQIDAIEKQKDAYQELIDKKKESLDISKKENDYEKSKADKIKQISKITDKINQLSLDDSRTAQTEKAKLLEQLAELEGNLTDQQQDYSLDKAKESLDKQNEEYQKSKDKEIAILEKSISSEEKLYQAALKRINDGYSSLYNDLKNWNDEYGNQTSETLESCWSIASQALQEYNSFLEATLSLQEKINNASSSTTVGQSGSYETGDTKSILSQMKANSMAWYTADSATQSNLSSKNKELAAQLSSTLGENVISKNGSWYRESDPNNPLYSLNNTDVIKSIVDKMEENSRNWTAGRVDLEADNIRLASYVKSLTGQDVTKKDGVWYISGKKLFDVYHTGGIVGGGASSSIKDILSYLDLIGAKGVKSNEVMSLLQKGEVVLDDTKIKGLSSLFDYATKASSFINKSLNSGQNPLSINAPLTIYGLTGDEVIKEVKKYPKIVSEMVSKELLRIR